MEDHVAPTNFPTAISRLAEYGFPTSHKLLFAARAGSGQSGVIVEGESDLDIHGVFLESAHTSLGFGPQAETFVYKSKGDQGRYSVGDLDIKFFSLRRWAQLAVKGDPGCISMLFLRDSTEAFSRTGWRKFTMRRTDFLTQALLSKYHGWAESEATNAAGGGRRQRPELVERFGYDVKAAALAMRFFGEGLEVLNARTLTFPRPDADQLLRLRTGEYTKIEALRLLIDKRDEFLSARDEKDGDLPLKMDEMDQRILSRIVVDTYLTEYFARRSGMGRC